MSISTSRRQPTMPASLTTLNLSGRVSVAPFQELSGPGSTSGDNPTYGACGRWRRVVGGGGASRAPHPLGRVLRAIAAAPSVVRVEALQGRRAGQAFGRAQAALLRRGSALESCRAQGAVTGGACPGGVGEDDDRNGARAKERNQRRSFHCLADLVGRLCPGVKMYVGPALEIWSWAMRGRVKFISQQPRFLLLHTQRCSSL
jgi:hypothetical protein